MTPLHYAAFCGFDDVVSFLLEKVLCVDTIIEERFRTSLLAAIYGGKQRESMGASILKALMPPGSFLVIFSRLSFQKAIMRANVTVSMLLCCVR